MKKEIGLGYILSIVTPEQFQTEEMKEVFKEWSSRTYGKDHIVPRKAEWMMNNYELVITVHDKDGFLAGSAGIIRSYENKNPVFHPGQDGASLEVHELCTNIVHGSHDGRRIGQYMMYERLRIAQENNWVAVMVTRSGAIDRSATYFGMRQTYKFDDIVTLGEQIRNCACANPDETKGFCGPRCTTCPLNGGIEGSKVIYARMPNVPLPKPLPLKPKD